MSEEISLVQRRLGAYLCEDVRRGKSCPHHEEQAADLYQVVLRAQREEREQITKDALDRLAGKAA